MAQASAGARAGTRQKKDIEEAYAQPKEPGEAEEPNNDRRSSLRRNRRNERDEWIGYPAEEAPDVVGGIGLDEQAEQHAAQQRVHQCRQQEVRQVIVPVAEDRDHGQLLRAAQYGGTRNARQGLGRPRLK